MDKALKDFVTVVENKVIEAGVYYVDQQVNSGNGLYDEDNFFTKREISFLESRNSYYFYRLASDRFENNLEFSNKELKAIDKALKDYPPFGLINDWDLGIMDYDYDRIMLDFIIRNKDIENLNEKLYIAVYEFKLEKEVFNK